jgi:hypothetical protein
VAKRKKDKDPEWTPSAIQEYINEQFRQRMVSGEYESPAQAAAASIGLRLPHLALRYLFQRVSFPLERVVILFGPSESNKSSLLYWLYDLFRRAGGRYVHLEVEDKPTPDLLLSLTGYDDLGGLVEECETMDKFQEYVDSYIDSIKSMCGQSGGPGRRVPFVVGIDSLTAKMTADAVKTTAAAKGVTGRRFADEARSLNDWFKYVPPLLRGWPFGLVAVCHDKEKAVEGRPGQKMHHTPGGAAPKYYATYRLLLQRTKALPQTATGWEGNRIKLSTEKNSMGTSRLWIEADIRWVVAATPSRSGVVTVGQRTVWDFDKATTELLYRLKSDKGARGRAVDEVVGIVKQTNGRYSAKPLGIAPGDALPPAEFARVLEGRPELLAELEPRLGIHPSRIFDQTQDFSDQLDAARAAVDDYVPAGGQLFGAADEGEQDADVPVDAGEVDDE